MRCFDGGNETVVLDFPDNEIDSMQNVVQIQQGVQDLRTAGKALIETNKGLRHYKIVGRSASITQRDSNPRTICYPPLSNHLATNHFIECEI